MNLGAKIILWIVGIVLIVWGGYGLINRGGQKPAEAEKLKVGAVLTLTGGGGPAGEEVRDGMELAMKEFPEPPIELFIEDSATDPKQGVSALNKLIDVQKIDIAIVTLSAIANAVTPIAIERHVPIIQTLVSTPHIATQSPYTFRYFHSSDKDAEIGVKIAREKIKANTAGIIYVNDEYGRTQVKFFKEGFEAAGGIIVEEQPYVATENDFRTYILKVSAAKPDLIYLVGLREVAIVLRQIKELNIKKPILSNAALSSYTFRQAAAGADEGVYLVAPVFYFETPNKRAEDFIATYKSTYKKPPSHYAAIGYDLVYLLSKIKKEKGDMSEEIIEKLTNVKSMTGVMGDLVIDAEGEISYPLYPAVIKNQKLEQLSW